MRLAAYNASSCGCAFSSNDPRMIFRGSGEGGDPLHINYANIGRGVDNWWSMSRAGTLYWDDSGRKMFRRLPFRITGTALVFLLSPGGQAYYTLGGSGVDNFGPIAGGRLFTDPEFAGFFSEAQWRVGRLTLDAAIYGTDVSLLWEVTDCYFAHRTPNTRIHDKNIGRALTLLWSRAEDDTFTPAPGWWADTATGITLGDSTMQQYGSSFGFSHTSGSDGEVLDGSMSKGQGFVPETSRWVQSYAHTGANPMGHSYGFSYRMRADTNFVTNPPRSTWQMEVGGFLTAVPVVP